MGNFWSQPLRVEDTENLQLITSRTMNSALWFVNNKALEERILAFLAKYIEKHEVELYALVILGNHYHMMARFPKANRALFFKDFNARVAESVRCLVSEFRGGTLFERRYSAQAMLLDTDIMHYYKYCALQPVSAGLTERISEYPGYNSFKYSTAGIAKTYKLMCYGAYNAAKRTNPNISKKHFIVEHKLQYKRLPGFEELSRDEYRKILSGDVEKKRLELVKVRKDSGKSFVGREKLLKIRPGSYPHSTKKGSRQPLVLTECLVSRKKYLSWYFSVVEEHKIASERYHAGEVDVEFPPGTYKPTSLHAPMVT